MHVATVYCDWGMLYTLELPAEPVRALLPEGVPMRELRPGVAEVMLNIVRFPATAGGIAEPVWEIDFGVVLGVDNRAFPNGPPAVRACCLLNVASTSAAYDAECRRRGYPVHTLERLKFDSLGGAESIGISVTSADAPVAELPPLPRPAPTQGWMPFETVGQDVVRDEIGVLRINFCFSGTRTTLVGPAPGSMRLWAHPFFRGLPVETDARVVHRIALEPDARHALAFHKGDLPQ